MHCEDLSQLAYSYHPVRPTVVLINNGHCSRSPLEFSSAGRTLYNFSVGCDVSRSPKSDSYHDHDIRLNIGHYAMKKPSDISFDFEVDCPPAECDATERHRNVVVERFTGSSHGSRNNEGRRGGEEEAEKIGGEGRGGQRGGVGGDIRQDVTLVSTTTTIATTSPADICESVRIEYQQKVFDTNAGRVRRREMKDSQVRRRDEKNHRCSVCLKLFPSSQQLNQHSLVHSDIRRYPCRHCNKTFKQLSHQQQHLRIHTGDRPYKCIVEFCMKSFRQLSSLQQHMKGHIIRLLRRHTSSNSAVKNSSPASQEIHECRRDTKVMLARPSDFNCQICDKSCEDEVQFLLHTHSKHPQYWKVFSGGKHISECVCSSLPLSQANDVMEASQVLPSQAIPRHLQRHQREKRFPCEVCGKLFVRESGCVRHVASSMYRPAGARHINHVKGYRSPIENVRVQNESNRNRIIEKVPSLHKMPTNRCPENENGLSLLNTSDHFLQKFVVASAGAALYGEACDLESSFGNKDILNG